MHCFSAFILKKFIGLFFIGDCVPTEENGLEDGYNYTLGGLRERILECHRNKAILREILFDELIES
jgi:hypothetical protein